MGWDKGVEEAFKKAAERSDDGWIVTLVQTLIQSSRLSLTVRKSPHPTQQLLLFSNQKPASLLMSHPNFPRNHLVSHSTLTPHLPQLLPHPLHRQMRASRHETHSRPLPAEFEVLLHRRTPRRERRRLTEQKTQERHLMLRISNFKNRQRRKPHPPCQLQHQRKVGSCSSTLAHLVVLSSSGWSTRAVFVAFSRKQRTDVVSRFQARYVYFLCPL